MAIVISNYFLMIAFSHKGRIEAINQLIFFTSDSHVIRSIPLVGETQNSYQHIGVGLLKDSLLMGTFFLHLLTSHHQFIISIRYHLLLSKMIHGLFWMRLTFIILASECHLVLLNLIMKPSIHLVHLTPYLRSIGSINHRIMAHLLIHYVVYSLSMRASWRSWSQTMHYGMIITIIPPFNIPLRIISVIYIYPMSSSILRIPFLSMNSILKKISRILKRLYLLIPMLNQVLLKIYTLVHLSLHVRLRLIKPYFRSFMIYFLGPMRKFQVFTQI